MNRLADESSPYLRQHRENPVDWYAWGPDAFARALDEEKPLLLSVGYSSCHWCHVMAHESFEDPATALVMNEHFVNVKVDREERPDVDAIYMEATQAMTGRGGWPMTVFLTPEGQPFFAGTYFPKVARGGLPSFVELLEAVIDAWAKDRETLLAQAATLTGAIAKASRLDPKGGAIMENGDDPADLALRATAALRTWMVRAWDPGWGGFGHSPKFPQCAVIEMALREVARHTPPSDESTDEAFAVAATTLAGMASGGIYDHLGGGFCRYSTDERWLVPHFEKMLYDQASLVRTYLHGWQVSGDARWLQVVEETIAYVLRDLAMPGGGIAAAEDADSEGEEGRFYLWRVKEVKASIPDEPAEALLDWYGMTWKGNLAGRMEGGEGINLPHRRPGDTLSRPPEVEEARRLLLAARSERPRPGLDTKVLTEWNALFLSALTEAAATTGNTQWKAAAGDLGEFLHGSLCRDDGRWMRSFQDGRALHLGYAADYAWVIDAFTRLGELTGRAVWTERARTTADGLLDLFGDPDGGGFFTAGADAEQLVVRHKDIFDGSTPSSNSAAANALWRLGTLTGETRYLDAAVTTLGLLGERMVAQPAANAFAISVLDLAARGAVEIVITGDRPDLVEQVQRTYLPRAVLAWGESYPSPVWEGRTGIGDTGDATGHTTGTDGRAYLCENYACAAPTGDPAELARLLALTP